MLIGLNLNLTNGILKTNVRTDCCCWTAGDPEGRAGRLIPPSQHSRHNRSLPVSARSRRPLRVCVTPGTAPLIPDRQHTFLHQTSQPTPAWHGVARCLSGLTPVSRPLSTLLYSGGRRGFNSLPTFEDILSEDIIVC